ncbi:MAG: endonuclease [Candidatus Thorarchaeota archaeon]|nr:endonuclease [Candidatus Thorarchaeota archaeon]
MPLEDAILGLGVGLLIALTVYLIMTLRLKHRISLVEAEFRRLWAEQESRVREDAATRSRYVLKGKITEQIVPLLRHVFRYEPSDARFIGSPVDYVIFDGYSSVKDEGSDRPITVVLADVKTGGAALNKTEQRIKEAVEAGRVRWETIRVDL